MQFSLIDINSQGDGTFFTYANEQGQKKFFVCGSNAYGQLGLGHNRNVTEPEEIPTPASADGFALTDVQIRDSSTFLICENAQKEKKFFACGLNAYGQLGLGHRHFSL